MSAPGLTAVAAWDTALLEGAVATLEAVTGRLPAWRARTDGVARSLTDPSCWSGPAATAATSALGEVSAVATAMATAFGDSLDRLHDAAREARTAADLAGQALARAAAAGMALDQAGRAVVPAPAPLPDAAAGTPAVSYDALAEQAAAAERIAGLAADALRAAARAGAAAADSGGPLAALGGTGAFRPAGWAALARTVTADGAWVRSCLPVPGTSPEDVAAWWAGLSTPARDLLVHVEPRLVGSLDGLPAWARDQANRLLLDRALSDPSPSTRETAEAVAAELDREEAAGRTAQLWSLDLDDHLAAISYGDLDAADDVALLVPGVGNDVGDLDDLGDDARAVADAARDAVPGAAVAAVAWLGYRPPASVAHPAALLEGRAATGGAALAGDLAGLRAARAGDPVRGDDPLRTTVVAHSYGTVVVDRAAEEPGVLEADALVLLGSPGMDNTAAQLEAPEVFEASSLLDPVPWALDVHGWETAGDRFGATSLAADWDTLHWEYLDADRPTPAAAGEVVAGVWEAD
ncbi:alpha/beta hydrolase [Geodermatophilus sp. SYSU D01119]